MAKANAKVVKFLTDEESNDRICEMTCLYAMEALPDKRLPDLEVIARHVQAMMPRTQLYVFSNAIWIVGKWSKAASKRQLVSAYMWGIRVGYRVKEREQESVSA